MNKEIEELIISTSVRIARNLKRIPFNAKKHSAFDSVAKTIAQKPKTVEVIYGEEDHFRIRAEYEGWNLHSAYKDAKAVADEIEATNDIARDKDLGYLTACTTNVGTGMRVSVLMFMPAITLSNHIGNIYNQIRNRHITIRGTYGEGSPSSGYMYQISNQSCNYMNEAEILALVEEAVLHLGKLELKLQATLYKNNRKALTEKVMRSWDFFTRTKTLSDAEIVEHIAILRLGSSLGILNSDEVEIALMPYNLSK